MRDWTRGRIAISTVYDTMREIDAWLSDKADGLAVHRSAGDGGWTVTHAGSGCAVIRAVPRLQSAMAAARRLAELADWTQTAEVICSMKLRTRRNAIADKYRGTYETGPTASVVKGNEVSYASF